MKSMRRRQFVIGSASAAALTATGAWLGKRSASPDRDAAFVAPPAEFEDRSVGLDTLPAEPQFDVCIVGCGPAGAILALDLARAGLSTLIVEAGARAAIMARDPRYVALNDFVGKGSIEYPLASTRVMGVGGTSSIWTGRCPRFLPIDFEDNAYTPAGARWPVSYAQIEPYYVRAEST